MRKRRRESHFPTVRYGGFEESQIICYLWELVKSVESIGGKLKAGIKPGGENRTRECLGELADLEKQMRGRVRVEMRRYFVRRRRRNVRLLLTALLGGLCIVGIFSLLIGVDRVSGESMNPYLNHGDWIVYSRVGTRIQRGQVVVFEKNGESMVKRVAGLPGDTVKISDSGDEVFVNGAGTMGYGITEHDSPGNREETDTDGPGERLTVLDGQYMVLGDNRSVSIDSRDSRVGTVPQKNILGRVILIIRAG